MMFNVLESGPLKSQVLPLAALVISVQKSLGEDVQLSHEKIKHGWVSKGARQSLVL